jgi:hypothetical protein
LLFPFGTTEKEAFHYITQLIKEAFHHITQRGHPKTNFILKPVKFQNSFHDQNPTDFSDRDSMKRF